MKTKKKIREKNQGKLLGNQGKVSEFDGLKSGNPGMSWTPYLKFVGKSNIVPHIEIRLKKHRAFS